LESLDDDDGDRAWESIGEYIKASATESLVYYDLNCIKDGMMNNAQNY
jgi:hypothetical protein